MSNPGNFLRFFLVELRETLYRVPTTLPTRTQFVKKTTSDDVTLSSKLSKTSKNPSDGYKRTQKQEEDLQKMIKGKRNENLNSAFKGPCLGNSISG